MRLPVATFVRYRTREQDPTYNHREMRGAIWQIAEDAPLWHGNDFGGALIETAVLDIRCAQIIEPSAEGPAALAVILDDKGEKPDPKFQILIGWTTEFPTHEEALIDAGFVPVGRT